MKVLVLGASGATGQQVVRELIKRKINTRILIRESAVLLDDIKDSTFVETIKGNISELNDNELTFLLQDCNVVISCLGHNMTFQGMFGKPRYLVYDAVKKICETTKSNSGNNIKFILMSTTAYTNQLSGEENPWRERILLSLLNFTLPPHKDNMKVANYLVSELGSQDKAVKWIAVRPDTLISDEVNSPYEVFDSPVRSPIYNPGKTSRVNVGHFMVELATNHTLWAQWENKTPVIYNK
ncbi:NAD(P)H-binding protein [Gracilibacillus kekensis]|uniref:Uncharacterized conserved protein YbjT, contains NAD(P)-binding and DUF2867 domains n=1 Tax=Gracilibacillus kekensis TaxID=1027249 RepID=A0A1M7QQU5_9BACI|nr:NAD(P)H-binding protein [Gracilibacillus kekensis]SHN33972.1 Uncharacterized conserved protein YbjT, contains NAD(P)-binding and DUF2867 domains [Gracilibacillus kekensis]